MRNTSEALPALRKGLYLDPAHARTGAVPPGRGNGSSARPHNLKGASANVGAIAVQQDAHALELALKQFVRQSGNAAVETAALAQTFSPLLGALEEAFATVQTSVLEALPETPQPRKPRPSPYRPERWMKIKKRSCNILRRCWPLPIPSGSRRRSCR